MHRNLNFRKTTFFVIISAFLVASSSLVFQACQKSNDNNLHNGDDQGGYASDISRIEWANDDVISIADAVGQVYNGAYMRKSSRGTELGTCCTVGVDTSGGVNALHTFIIRFGPDDCVCLDGRKRRGTIIVKFRGHYTDTAQLHTISFNGYNINDNELTGTITTTRIDTTIAGNWYYRVNSRDSMNVSQDPLNSQFVVWSGSLVRKWVQGYNGSNTGTSRADDIFSISGSALLTRPNGNVFSCNIATPLQFAMDCNYCESGVVNISGYAGNRILNYGAGTCDAAAQLNIGVHIYQLTLTP